MRLIIDIDCNCEQVGRRFGGEPKIAVQLTTDVSIGAVRFETSKSESLQNPFKMAEEEMRILSTIGSKLQRTIEKLEAQYDCGEDDAAAETALQ